MAAILILRMTGVARKVCMSVGKDVVGNMGGAAQNLRIFRERFSPNAVESII